MTSRHLAIVYVSAGLHRATVEPLNAIALKQEAVLAHSFVDPIYNRTSFFFVGPNVAPSAAALASAALEQLDFSQHSGQHPALGAVDHVCFSPLGTTTLDETAAQASRFLQTMTGSQPHLPIYGYGHLTGHRLRDIRRRLGYFDMTASNALETLAQTLPVTPSTFNSSSTWSPKHGVMCVGVVPFVLNFNMRCRSSGSKATVAKITASIRSKEVEALTLQHKEGAFEVACNLLQSSIVSPSVVLARARARAAQVGAEIVDSYTTGPTEEALLESYNSKRPL
ncbi:hypothetical protein AC1031_003583 [Aphanomyces cochlioides]|nr:hypothetical protein AC1031_003583 [Aphanomyces cochlioides]